MYVLFVNEAAHSFVLRRIKSKDASFVPPDGDESWVEMASYVHGFLDKIVAARERARDSGWENWDIMIED